MNVAEQLISTARLHSQWVSYRNTTPEAVKKELAAAKKARRALADELRDLTGEFVGVRSSNFIQGGVGHLYINTNPFRIAKGVTAADVIEILQKRCGDGCEVSCSTEPNTGYVDFQVHVTYDKPWGEK